MMKKLLLIAVLAATSLCMSCSKDDEGKGVDPELAGSWVFTESYSQDGEDITYVETLKFTSATSVSYTFKETTDGKVTVNKTIKGNYTYESPDMTATFPIDGASIDMNATVSGNSMAVKQGNQFYGTFTR